MAIESQGDGMPMGKLVRNRIPDIILTSGRTPTVRVLGLMEYKTALHDKLIEEVSELGAATTAEERLGEAADILEVLAAIADLDGFTIDDVAYAARQKADERGSFTERLWLE
ncbi:nucleoside triphosphate pyrophosphohydrolase [Nocardia brasiliensis]|uniref:nucleoside triphosphate pyrophosphohydrolase n=1 Tax=Nocardia brasiliensis TaxID=37326 RepID=UPI003D921840